MAERCAKPQSEGTDWSAEARSAAGHQGIHGQESFPSDTSQTPHALAQHLGPHACHPLQASAT